MLGMIQVYTGDGKGKTTAAIGLAIRALGAGKTVLFLQFMKAKGYSEHQILSRLAPDLTLATLGKPFFVAPAGTISEEDKAKWGDSVVIFPPGQPPADYLALVAAGLERAEAALLSGNYDVVVLDEINVALHFGLVDWARLADMLDRKAAGTEVILTGRRAPDPLLAKAHLVTEMREIKHYYRDLGLEARLGIEN
ncbi:MAG: cob(I)yrinic acid a,c-diamide adenosyltransferase [Peptococcaceae bacterium]|jgi:cob(I)alamin adenosyltransferase|nr:cob(I)yrinic acid a,c-diamide adenosyltransferase [Peptococcaceae bacterium]